MITENKDDKFDVLILFSGGADSALMYFLAKMLDKNAHFLVFDYSQLHNDEIDKAKKFLSERNESFTELKITIPVKSALTTGDKGFYEGVNEYHVPSRNLIFISHAASLAEYLQIPEIWYGADFSDFENRFPDCYQEWIGRLNKLLEINGSFKVKVRAPLLGISKEEVLQILQSEGVLDEIFSGYGDL